MDERLENAEVTAGAESVDEQETVAKSENEGVNEKEVAEENATQMEIAEVTETEKMHGYGKKVYKMQKILRIIGVIVIIVVLAAVSFPYAFCKHEHLVQTVAAVAPTCTESGKTAQIKCAKCGIIVTYSESVSPLRHNMKSGVCTRCGEK